MGLVGNVRVLFMQNIFEPSGKKILGLQIVALLFTFYAVYNISLTWAVVSFICFFFISVFGLSFTLHRIISHRSWKPVRWFYNFLSLFSCFSLTGSPISYAYIHRLHHLYVDNDKDPHSPKHGKIHAMFGTHEPEKFHGNMIRDLLKDRYQVFLHRYYLLIVGTVWTIIALLSPPIFLYCLVVPGMLSGVTSRLHNWVTHEPRFGYRSFDTKDNSRNVPWLNVLFFFSGEGWANNHHAYAWEHNFGKRTNQIDIIGWFTNIFTKLRLGSYENGREGKTY